MGNIVAIVGRPNVGKSTLFNRLTGNRHAIVDDFSGVTRDRHYGKGEWLDKEFNVIDTGGYVPNSADVFEAAIRNQVKVAVQEADVILFMVDVAVGITDLDTELSLILRKSKKPVLLVVNKVDNNNRQLDAAEFWSLGFDAMYNISSASGSGTGDLLDEAMKHLTFTDEDVDAEAEDLPKIAIIGRPNVGKSSLINALLGVERNIVTDIAGTTRDSINSHYKLFEKEFVLIDTAGIRRKNRVSEDLEFYSVMRSIKALEDCDVTVLVIDATVGLDSQDMNLVTLAVKNNKGLIILVNKWDLIEKDTKTAIEYEKVIREKLKPFSDVPIIFTSAVTKQRIFKAVEVALHVAENRNRKISTSKLNEYILDKIETYPPPPIKGKFVKIKYATQLPGRSPKFAFFCNHPQYVSDSYKRFIENKLRDEYDFEGVPIVIYMRKK
ncbi:MAG: ribosome biogenesis GTPase Der [Bacteroidota bacterium]